MSNAALANIIMPNNRSNIIPFEKIKPIVTDEPFMVAEEVGRDDCDNRAGEDTEVYAFRTREEIAAVINVFDRHIEEAETDNQRQIACRNKMLFVIGINVGIRASDLRTLKWSFFFDVTNGGEKKFKQFYTLQPMKQRKQKKFVKLFFNKAVKQAIESYVSEYPFNTIDEYLFASRKGDKPITVGSLWRIVKNAALEAGIQQNVGSHTLRKTFGRFCFIEAQDKTKALVMLQKIFNHSDTLTTMKYIGILDDEIEDMFNSIDLGLDMI